MANNANWTIVMDDKVIIKKSGDGAGNAYTINDDAFWSDSKWSNIWDAAHLAKLQADWDADDRDESEKGSRPTSYSS